MPLDSTRARMLGQIGQARRWARVVDPEARRAATQKARDARLAKLVLRARSMEGGADLTPEQLDERVRQLSLADMASMRLARLDRRRAAA